MRKILLILLCLVSLIGCSTKKINVDELGGNFIDNNGQLEYSVNTIDEIAIDVTHLNSLLSKYDDEESKQYISEALDLVIEELEQKSNELQEKKDEASKKLNELKEQLNNIQ